MDIFRCNDNNHYLFIKKNKCLIVNNFYENWDNSVKTEFYKKNPFDLSKFEKIELKDVPKTIINTLNFLSTN